MYHAFQVGETAEVKSGTRVTILRIGREPDGPTPGKYDVRYPDGQVDQNVPGYELKRLVSARRLDGDRAEAEDVPTGGPARPREEAPARAMAPTTTRHVCPACFSGVDVGEDGTIRAHRYAAPTPWRAGRSDCPGVGKVPFNTKPGLAVARAEANEGRRWAKVRREESKRVESGRGFVYGASGTKVENPTDFERQQYALQLASLADAADRAITAITNRIEGWREAQ